MATFGYLEIFLGNEHISTEYICRVRFIIDIPNVLFSVVDLSVTVISLLYRHIKYMSLNFVEIFGLRIKYFLLKGLMHMCFVMNNVSSEINEFIYIFSKAENINEKIFWPYIIFTFATIFISTLLFSLFLLLSCRFLSNAWQ